MKVHKNKLQETQYFLKPIKLEIKDKDQNIPIPNLRAELSRPDRFEPPAYARTNLDLGLMQASNRSISTSGRNLDLGLTQASNRSISTSGRNLDFDIVIPVADKDIKNIKKQLFYTLRNIIGYKNIYLIVSRRVVKKFSKISLPNIFIIDETIFPFTITDLIARGIKSSRAGWYLQQLLKLYSGEVLGLSNYLVIDADTYFLKPTEFIKNNIPLYSLSEEHHPPYFEHIRKMGLPVVSKKSAICHHMFFETRYINELFSLFSVPSLEGTPPFWHIFIDSVNKSINSGASEYEMYFNFILAYHSDKIRIRQLNWKNSDHLPLDKNLDFVSIHIY